MYVRLLFVLLLSSVLMACSSMQKKDYSHGELANKVTDFIDYQILSICEASEDDPNSVIKELIIYTNQEPKYTIEDSPIYGITRFLPRDTTKLSDSRYNKSYKTMLSFNDQYHSSNPEVKVKFDDEIRTLASDVTKDYYDFKIELDQDSEIQLFSEDAKLKTKMICYTD